MPSDRRRSRTGLAVLVLISLLLLTVDYRQGEGGVVAALQRGAVTVFAPVQEGFAITVRPVGRFVASIAELGQLRAENAALEAELDQLRDSRVSVADLRRENEELREQLEMRQRHGFTTTGAQIIAQPANVFDNTVMIDVGTQAGVAPGQAVINADGLVGKVVAATGRNARVQLLTSPEASYAARLADSGEEGLLSGRGSRPFQLEVFDPELEVEAGEEVVTHAFQGSSIPDGIPVGEVAAGVEEGATTRFLAIRPYVDFTRLITVQVVLDAPTQPMLDDEDLEVEPSDADPPEGEQSDGTEAPGDDADVDGEDAEGDTADDAGDPVEE